MMTKRAPLEINQVADWFLNRVDREAGDSITPLALQKLVFFAQAWHLANRGYPLFQADFQAWAHGPVVRSLWDRFKQHKWDALPPSSDTNPVDEDSAKILEQVYQGYGQYTAKKLEELSHEARGPWALARAELPPEARCENVISKESIRDFYGKKIGKKWKGPV